MPTARTIRDRLTTAVVIVAMLAGLLVTATAATVAVSAVTAPEAGAGCGTISASGGGQTSTANGGCSDGSANYGSNVGLNPGYVWCSGAFGNAWVGQIPATSVAPQQGYIIDVVTWGNGSHMPPGCGWRAQAPTGDCVVTQRVHLNGVVKNKRHAYWPWKGDNCLGDWNVDLDAALAPAVADICSGAAQKQMTYTFQVSLAFSRAPFTYHWGEPQNVTQRLNQLTDDCPTSTTTTTRPTTSTSMVTTTTAPQGPAGSSVTITVDPPNAPAVGGKLRPQTFESWVHSFVCVSPCGDPSAGSPFVLDVTYDMDLAGTNGYTEGADADFIEADKNISGGSSMSRRITTTAEFYEASTGEERIRTLVRNTSGTYRYFYWETITIYITDEDGEVTTAEITVRRFADAAIQTFHTNAPVDRKVIAATATPD